MAVQTTLSRDGVHVLGGGAWLPDELRARLAGYSPRSDLGRIIKDCFRFLPLEAAGELLDAITRVVVLQSSLSLVIVRRDGLREALGIVGNKVITDAGVGFLVDAWQNLVELENMKYHALGTGTTAEAASGAGAAMVTELTTEYTGNVRATGTTTEASALVFQTVATNTLDGTPGAALREHGLMSANAAGVCWDRTLFDAITLISGEGLQSTYNMTGVSGG